jgi:SHS2 domain-containing protein
MPKRNRFQYLEKIATADAAFEAYGRTLPELFENAALAMFGVMAPLELIGTESVRDVTVAAETDEELLFNWLAELVYLKDVHAELYSKFSVRIEYKEELMLAAEIRGDAIASVRDSTHTDVKAVTYHKLAIEHRDTGYVATVVLDL